MCGNPSESEISLSDVDYGRKVGRALLVQLDCGIRIRDANDIAIVSTLLSNMKSVAVIIREQVVRIEFEFEF